MRRLTAAVAVLAAACAACAPPPQKMLDASPKPTDAATTTTAAAGTAPTTSPAPAKPNATTTTVAVPADPLAGLTIAEETEPPGYSRERFKHWTKDKQGCTTRERVLKAESTTPAQVDPYGCKVIAGDWTSAYDAAHVTDPSELDVDHMVPLHEAWQSGAAAWDDAKREAYANDDANPESLRAVTAATNRSKADNDPTGWVPNDGTFLCQYVTEWVTVKRRYQLSVDPAEASQLRKIFAACPAGTGTAQAAASTKKEGGLDPMAMLLIAAIGLSMLGGGSSSNRRAPRRRR